MPATEVLARLRDRMPKYKTINDQISISDLPYVASLLNLEKLIGLPSISSLKPLGQKTRMTWNRHPYCKKERKKRDSAEQNLSEDEIYVRILRPLRKKGKTGRNHTSPIETLYGHGIPDHQKHKAKSIIENWIEEGVLEEKPSQGRRHVWISSKGLKLLNRKENNGC